MSLDIYFCGSISGGRQDAEIYARIIKHLKGYGTVLNEQAGSKDTVDEDEKDVHDRDMKWLDQADVLIAEVTQPSLGVGYEIGRGVAKNKRLLCLFRPSAGKNLSAMIRGLHNGDSIVVRDYKESELPDVLKDFLSDMNIRGDGGPRDPESDPEEAEDLEGDNDLEGDCDPQE